MGRRKRFLVNTAVMTGGSLLLRLINLGFRAWMFANLGARAVGEYQLMMTVFFLAVTACTSGFGFAITRMVAEGIGGRRQLRLCTATSLTLSVLAGGAMWLAAPVLGNTLLGGAETVWPLRLLVLGLPLMALSACLKGYLTAARNALLPALSELLELLSTIGFVAWLFGFSPQLVALCLGATLGETLSCVFVAISYLWVSRRKRFAPGGSAGFRTMWHIAAPVFFGNLVRSALSSFENLMIPQSLAAFSGAHGNALAQYGTVGGMVYPVLLLPLCVLTSASVLLVPELAEMKARGRRGAIENAAKNSIELALWFSFIAASVMFFYAPAIGRRFFGSEQAGVFLRIMTPIVPILYLDSVVDGMLKGLDQQLYSFGYNIVDGVLRVAFALVVVPHMGISGYFLLLFLSEIFNCALSLGRLVKVSRIKVDIVWWLIAPLLAAVDVYLLLRLSSSFFSGL